MDGNGLGNEKRQFPFPFETRSPESSSPIEPPPPFCPWAKMFPSGGNGFSRQREHVLSIATDPKVGQR